MIGFKDLLPEELESLSDLKYHSSFKALVKIIEAKKFSLGRQALGASDFDEVRYAKGAFDALTSVVDTVRLAAKKVEKASGKVLDK